MIQNRRDYYRIKDKAHIQYHLLDSTSGNQAEEHFRFPAYLAMMNDLHTLDLEANRLLAHIPDSERTTAALFRVINKKIEKIARTLTLVESNIPAQDFQTIDISEGGMAFHAADSLPQGQKLIVKIILIPVCFSILTEAEVVACEAPGDIVAPENFPHWTRVNFVDIDDKQQQMLAKHILRIQQQKRREQHN